MAANNFSTSDGKSLTPDSPPAGVSDLSVAGTMVSISLTKSVCPYWAATCKAVEPV